MRLQAAATVGINCCTNVCQIIATFCGTCLQENSETSIHMTYLPAGQRTLFMNTGRSMCLGQLITFLTLQSTVAPTAKSPSMIRVIFPRDRRQSSAAVQGIRKRFRDVLEL